MSFLFVLLASMLIGVNAQLGSYAGGGRGGSGYKDAYISTGITVSSTPTGPTTTTSNSLGTRGGFDANTASRGPFNTQNSLPNDNRYDNRFDDRFNGNERIRPQSFNQFPNNPNFGGSQQPFGGRPGNPISQQQRLSLEIELAQQRLDDLLAQQRRYQNGQFPEGF